MLPTALPRGPGSDYRGCENYVISYNGSGSIVSGTTDIGNHTDDGATLITLPFPVTIYDQTYTTANAAPTAS